MMTKDREVMLFGKKKLTANQKGTTSFSELANFSAMTLTPIQASAELSILQGPNEDATCQTVASPKSFLNIFLFL
jgi:hypothetical protein